MPVIGDPATTSTDYVLVLDPSEVAEDRAELDLNSGPIRVDRQGVDWGDAQIQAYMADLQVGSAPVDYRLPNRIVTIPLGLGMDDSGQAGFDAARQVLQQKVGRFQAEGGWLKRESNVGPLYADIVSATLAEPDRWGQAGGVEADVKMVLECLPDFYGDEQTLISTSGSGVLTGAIGVTDGAYPGRVRAKVTDTSANDQNALLHGFRYYDADATAALQYDAADLTEIASAATSTGAALSPDAWAPLVSTEIAATSEHLTHHGIYRVWCRASSDSTPDLRLVWDVGDLARPEENDSASIPVRATDHLLDLGTIFLTAPPVGAHRWQGIIQGRSPVDGDTVTIKELLFQPIGQTAGRLESDPGDSPGVSTVSADPGTSADSAAVGTVAWSNPTNLGSGSSPHPKANLGAAAVSHYLTATNFGFAIPAAATIQGIKLSIVRSADSGYVADSRVRLIKGGVVEATDKADTVSAWPMGFDEQIYGTGSTDLWGGAWTPADVNASDFGIALSAQAPGAAAQAQVLSMTLTVYYALGGSGFTTEDAVVFASQTCEIRTDGAYREDSAGAAYGPVTVVIGDLPRIPPSGAEGWPVELFLKLTRGTEGQPYADPGPADGFDVEVVYRPCYLGRV